ncbi:MAG: hypothetical protein Q9217_006228, partial [Psora testacea]
MLSAFTARPLVELKQRDKSKIESILAYGDRLLVGLNTGSLRIYRINESLGESASQASEAAADQGPTSQAGPNAVDLLREQEKFSKQRIEQLALVKEANILLSLSNGYVHMHDLHSYELQETLSKSKGASTFAVASNVVKDASTGVNSIVTRLAVAVKRRFMIWTWQDGELDAENIEMTLATGIKNITWATDTRLFAGLNANYVLVDIETLTATDIVGPGSIGGAPGQDGGRFGGAGVASMGYLGLSAPKPLATKLGKGEMLLAKDINTLFVDMDGNSLGRRQIPWAVAPEAVGYAYPYLLALQASKGTLEVRNPETLTLLQAISLPAASQLHVPQPNISLAHAGKGFLVLSERCIWRMQALDYNSQISALVERGKLDEAISLLDLLEDALLKNKAGRMREVKMQKALRLFNDRKFRDSIDLFTEVNAPPERVIGLYPPIIAGSASASSGDLSEVQADGSSHSVSRNSGDHNLNSSKGGSSDDGKCGNPSKRSSACAVVESVSQAGPSKPLATEELRGFLVSARTKMKKVLNTDGTLKIGGLKEVPESELGSMLIKPSFDASVDQKALLETARLVDTTLFRAYMFVSPSFAGPLFRIDNFCDPDVVNEKLNEAGRYNDLVDFFYGKKLHRQALELLRRFGGKEPTEVAPQLAGPRRTVTYLQSLPPELIDLILEFAEWPLRKDPDLGMEVFLADTGNAETLPRPIVLDFLEGLDCKLAIRYLEHIIYELNDTTPSFHQRLADVYIEGLKVNDFPNDDARDEWKQKTLEFLRTSKNYQVYKVLGQLKADDPRLYEARAIVLSNMGQHKQALDIYVFKLQDANKAEEYCNQIYLREVSTTPTSRRPSITETENAPPSIYQTLLSLYLSPPPPHKPQWGPALNVLAKHGARMPASSTLDLIPEVLPIKDLESYFRGQIRSANTIANEGRIVAGLRSALAFSEEAKLRLGDGIPSGNGGRNRRVVITEDKVCGVCYKRFGGSAIKVMPKCKLLRLRLRRKPIAALTSMNSTPSTYRLPGAFSPRPPSSPNISQGQKQDNTESEDESSSPHANSQSREQYSPRPQQYARPSVYPDSAASNSTTSVNNFSRPGFTRQTSTDPATQHSGPELKGHRRQHSQGFFEPSLSSASISDQSLMANLTASQIAAQAAMQHQSHSRQRSQTTPSPHQSPPGTMTGRRKPPPIQTASSDGTRRLNGPQTPGRQFYNGAVGGHSGAAATAANAAYPGKLSPGLSAFDIPPPEKEHKLKSERSKMKLFSKPKDKSNKDTDKDKPMPSPNKIGSVGASALSKMVNPSVTSLADSLASGAPSIYSMNTGNASTSTLVPADRQKTEEKEKSHKHHFLSRQKNKLKDKIGDDHILPLSSASSNSRPLDPSAPSSLYSFAPTPASPAATSFTGLDLRHAGRAVREKKKEEKNLPFAPKISDIDRIDFGPSGRTTPSLFHNPTSSNAADPALQGFGLQNMRPEDAWDFLKAKLLIIFEREELRIPVEDLNRLVTVHIQRCIVKRNPTIIIEDLQDLLSTGFQSLNKTLRGLNDQRIVPHLVEIWLFVFGVILPYIQAVFLPLDLEFKGHGSLLATGEAADFWGASADSNADEAFGNTFDVRRMVLLSYRDNVILPRYEALKTTFSRLSLDSINASASPIVDSFDTLTSSSSNRPGTAGSLDPGSASYNSQSSTLYDNTSLPSRSRGNSNLSAPELPSFASPPSARQRQQRQQQMPDSSQVTETVGRMLQC